jgi:hypothetical protein
VGKVWEVVSDRPDEDLGLWQPLLEPCSIGTVDRARVEREVRRTRGSEVTQPFVARPQRLF